MPTPAPRRRPSTYDVFLSYTAEQRPLVQAIRASLQTAGLSVFLDEKDLHFTRSFDQSIQEAIAASSVMIFVLSERSVRPGSYALFELAHAFNTWSDPQRIITIHADATAAPAQLHAGLHLRPEEHRRLVRAARRCRRRDPRVRGTAIATGLSVLGTSAVLLSLGGTSVWVLQGKKLEPTPPNASMMVERAQPEVHVTQVGTTKAEPTHAPRARAAPPRPEPSVVELPLGEGAILTFVRIPGGSFTMGPPRGSLPSTLPEPQQHQTVHERWMTNTEITRKVWRAIMGAPKEPCKKYWCSDDHPMTFVDYPHALVFANTLSERLDLTPCYEQQDDAWVERPACDGVRLPSEIEWEHAARAGSKGTYSFGDDSQQLCQYGNGRDARRASKVRSDLPALGCSDSYVGLAPVARFRPNAYGLYDMHGNAWEWVTGPAPGGSEQRLLRGGSFLDGEDGLRSAKRYQVNRKWRSTSVGFRFTIDRMPSLAATSSGGKASP